MTRQIIVIEEAGAMGGGFSGENKKCPTGTLVYYYKLQLKKILAGRQLPPSLLPP